MTRRRAAARVLALASLMLMTVVACGRTPRTSGTFATPEGAVHALIAAVRTGPIENVIAIFGQDGQALVDSSDPASTRRNREIFTAAVAETWRLVDQDDGRKVLVIGNEQWPFPVPLVPAAGGWRFDTAAGKEEVLDRRIGRNELMVMTICRTYVAAQRLYAEHGHDGQPAERYATALRSAPGREDGLFWPTPRGHKRSPLGDLVASAALEGRAIGRERQHPSPFHGYYFKILTAQGPSAPGGARSFMSAGGMSGGFALVAWPAQYDVTGVMTFIVNQEGVVRQKDLGAGSDAAARAMTLYDPDPSWTAIQ